MGTLFIDIYNRFLGKITDDMYVELTPEDTIKDLQQLLVDAIPEFEFPRQNLYDYTINLEEIGQQYVGNNDFIISTDENTAMVIVDRSSFAATLTEEEMNIIATLMTIGWLQRQIDSIENTRMKYSGADFKFTSQANHLQKLITSRDEKRRQSMHLQRLYKRRRFNKDGKYESNWSVLSEVSALEN